MTEAASQISFLSCIDLCNCDLCLFHFDITTKRSLIIPFIIFEGDSDVDSVFLHEEFIAVKRIDIYALEYLQNCKLTLARIRFPYRFVSLPSALVHEFVILKPSFFQ